MPAFPRHSIAWKLEEKTTLRRVSLSLSWYGVGIGIVVRLYRWGILSFVVPATWGLILASISGGLILLCALSVGHLMNFTVRSWRWRAPALGAFITLGESATSLVLILVHQERMGRALATLSDWPREVRDILVTRVVAVSLFALVLAAVVLALRKTLPDEKA